MNLKKLIIGTAGLLLAAGWCIRYYTLNGTFAVHSISKAQHYYMYEPVPFEDNMSYGGSYFPGYSVAINRCRLIEAENYLQEIGKTAEDFEMLPERFLEVTLDLTNHTGEADGVSFYGMPLIGTNWYAFYSPEATAYINPFFEDDPEIANGAGTNVNETATVKIAYALYQNLFTDAQWAHLEQEPMQIMTTVTPVEKWIKLELTE